ncbi:hypothetical protein JOD64_000664 [Micromonospora luteifusca]|uniref:Uncharacterized protein n=1 Tax=Micromonospora luteifusca TaxID=709860 RepID=A0ABS2LN95_9ACTN|nr:hypothetical protein [Micromonospora luteifusca]MBM7489442.1 hypothetical protein [Micromonospora luteifusca]
MAHSSAPASDARVAGTTANAFRGLAGASSGLRISQHDAWTTSDTPATAFTWICLADAALDERAA